MSRWQVRHERCIEYDLLTTSDLFDPANPALLSLGRIEAGRRFVVVDTQVARHHGARIRAYFDGHGINARTIECAGGEANKTIDTWQAILRELDAFPLHRRDEPIIAIGGGVLTDVVGFVASAFRRGVPHIKVPTTLMGYVDAAVGIKTGINFNGHKNRLGSFEPPQRVLLDATLLRTLSRRHVLNGVSEIIKLAVIQDAGLFALLEAHGAASVAATFTNPRGNAILERAIAGMLTALEPNLYEGELARAVDFGHTFSYGLEARHPTRLLHGEAVLLDILVSTVLAEQRGLLAPDNSTRIFALVEALAMRPDIELLDTESMWQALCDRVEHRNGRQHVPMPRALGSCVFVQDVTRPELESATHSLHERIGHEPVLEF